MLINVEYLVEAGLCKSSEAEKWVEPINAAMERFEINTPERVAGFLAQCAHESAHFARTTENLNYSADGLRRVFPKYFRDVDANDYHRQPEKIANRVYSSRMGNGDEDSGDGWRYRGRGLIQLTGRSNYSALAADIDVDVVEDPDLVAEPELAALSAAWFWWKNGLNKFADAQDIVGMTKRINGGTIGLEERRHLYHRALAAA
jgi:putative chitinase